MQRHATHGLYFVPGYEFPAAAAPQMSDIECPLPSMATGLAEFCQRFQAQEVLGNPSGNTFFVAR